MALRVKKIELDNEFEKYLLFCVNVIWGYEGIESTSDYEMKKRIKLLLLKYKYLIKNVEYNHNISYK